MSFGSLVTLERYARIDFSLRIDLPWAALCDTSRDTSAEILKSGGQPPRQGAARAALRPRHDLLSPQGEREGRHQQHRCPALHQIIVHGRRKRLRGRLQAAQPHLPARDDAGSAVHRGTVRSLSQPRISRRELGVQPRRQGFHESGPCGLAGHDIDPPAGAADARHTRMRT
jgi:hypothetical protein